MWIATFDFDQLTLFMFLDDKEPVPVLVFPQVKGGVIDGQLPSRATLTPDHLGLQREHKPEPKSIEEKPIQLINLSQAALFGLLFRAQR